MTLAQSLMSVSLEKSQRERPLIKVLEQVSYSFEDLTSNSPEWRWERIYFIFYWHDKYSDPGSEHPAPLKVLFKRSGIKVVAFNPGKIATAAEKIIEADKIE